MNSTSVSFGERLLAVGGQNRDQTPSSDVNLYNPCTDSWSRISQMRVPRYNSLVTTILATNELLVMGGKDS